MILLIKLSDDENNIEDNSPLEIKILNNISMDLYKKILNYLPNIFQKERKDIFYCMSAVKEFNEKDSVKWFIFSTEKTFQIVLWEYKKDIFKKYFNMLKNNNKEEFLSLMEISFGENKKYFYKKSEENFMQKVKEFILLEKIFKHKCL